MGKGIDKSNMLELLLDFPLQFKTAQSLAKNATVSLEKKNFSKIVFCGLGGSAIGADLVRSYLYFESKLPIIVCREYELPAYVDELTLVFIASYSGNTEETISAYQQAREKGANIIVLSSDGILKEYAQKDKISFMQIPAGLPPRNALGYLSIIPLCILARLGLIKDVSNSIYQVVKTLEDLKNNHLHPRIAVKDNISKYVAKKLINKFTVVYSGSINFDVVATRFRGQLAENSKALASSHVFPEMNHNEIVGWQNPKKLFKNFAVVMFKDKGLYPRVAKRMAITKELIEKEGVPVIEINSLGEDLLSRIFSLVYIGDFISYYLALLYGIDPTPVDKVTYLKNRLAQD